MITSILVYSAVDSFASSLALDDLNYPLQKFDFEPEMDGADIAKMQAAGRYSWRKDVRHMSLTIEGEILGTDTTDFWTKRKALRNKFIPVYNNTIYDPIKIRLTVDGDAEVYYGFFILESIAGALEVTGGPSVQGFQMILSCRYGYWRKESDDSRAIL